MCVCNCGWWRQVASYLPTTGLCRKQAEGWITAGITQQFSDMCLSQPIYARRWTCPANKEAAFADQGCVFFYPQIYNCIILDLGLFAPLNCRSLCCMLPTAIFGHSHSATVFWETISSCAMLCLVGCVIWQALGSCFQNPNYNGIFISETPVWNSWEPLPIIVDNMELDGTIVRLSIRQLPIVLSELVQCSQT